MIQKLFSHFVLSTLLFFSGTVGMPLFAQAQSETPAAEDPLQVEDMGEAATAAAPAAPPAEEPLLEEATLEDEMLSETPPPPEPPYPGAAEEGFQPQSTAVKLAEPPAQISQPIKKAEDGTYYYAVENSKIAGSSSVRMGFFSPPKLTNPANNTFWKDIYSGSNIPTVFADYEWRLLKSVGDLGLKGGSGLFMSQGKGRFADPTRSDERPDEVFSFIMLPNTVTAIYRIRYFDKQPIVPYVEGGAGYFTFMELRDDGKRTKFGAAPVSVAAGGVSFMLDWLDSGAVRELDREYGINHVYLNAEYRMIVGLNKTYDFTSTVMNAGIVMDF